MAAGIVGESVDYNAGDTKLRGYRAQPADGTAGNAAEGAGPRPGVLVIHEWWGLNDYIRSRADKLAELGYTAFAPDMYGDGKVADNPDEAGALMGGVLSDIPAAEARLAAAIDQLRNDANVDNARLAAIGYCFGGAMVLHAARTGAELAGVVSFHGALGSNHTPAPGEVKAKILVCHGAADALVPAEDVAAFKEEMAAAQADMRFKEYDGALHGFSNPEATGKGEKYGLPLAYNEAVDEQSWADMQAFFGEIFS